MQFKESSTMAGLKKQIPNIIYRVKQVRLKMTISEYVLQECKVESFESKYDSINNRHRLHTILITKPDHASLLISLKYSTPDYFVNKKEAEEYMLKKNQSLEAEANNNKNQKLLNIARQQVTKEDLIKLGYLDSNKDQ